MNKKSLKIKGTLLDYHQLEKYMEKIASDHVLQEYSEKNTYPVPVVLDHFSYITKVYRLLNEHVKLGIAIHPAGEWLLDNYYIIEEIVKVIQKDLSLKKYQNFLGLSNGENKGYARIYVLASEMIAYTENHITQENLLLMLQAYQKKKTLSMEEIWNIGIFLQISLIAQIKEVCEKIYSSQLQKYKVENMVERYIEGIPKEKAVFKIEGKMPNLGFGEMKYPFIEYMSYRLKKIGRKAYGYLDALEEQVDKMGTTISEVIKKEHFDIALRKISIGNSITSMKELARTNFLEIFEQINGVEEILKQDPAGIYDKMDYRTKEEYRRQVQILSKKTKISEMYIAQKLVEIAQKEKEENGSTKKAHIGYYLLQEGRQDLLLGMGIRAKEKWSEKQKSICFEILFFLFSSLFAIGFGVITASKTNVLIGIVSTILAWIPCSEILLQITQAILSKVVVPKRIPKLDFSNGIPEEDSTMVIMPTILSSKDKVKELFQKLEVYYLANQSPNLYFTLLGDCTSEEKETLEIDQEIIQEGRRQVQKLNEKYPSTTPIFHFLYRVRRWNPKEKYYLGWERKRGLITQFNCYLLHRKQDDFLVNTIEEIRAESEQDPYQNIRYIITLDSDTELVLDSAFELVGAMAHILNKAKLDKRKKVVVEGHALLQPTVGVSLEAGQKSFFSRIYAGAAGTDCYSNAISNFYQDNFDEGIFSGKGIYDLAIFDEVLGEEIPENTVLSHDLLEGNYLRSGLATDVLLMDGYPCKYNSFMARLHRWIRGDWQIVGWLKSTIVDQKGKKKRNPLSTLSKFKIFDNLRRSLLEIMVIFLFFFGMLASYKSASFDACFFLLAIFTLWMPNLIEGIEQIVSRKEGQQGEKTFAPVISGFKGNALRAILNLAFLPDKAYVSFNAIGKTLYRKYVSHEHLLEWTTAEEAEKKAKTDYLSYYRNMAANVVLGLFAILLGSFLSSIILKIITILLGLLWLLGPFLACYISKEEKAEKIEDRLSQEERDYLMQIGKETWQYFKDSLTQKNHYLPPDNYQESRVQKFVPRTSSTNIGLALLAVVSSYDMGYETLENTILLLEKMLNTIRSLSKWNGHLYNWYQIETLEPLMPRYVSTVDSGNFVGYLYVLKQFLLSIKEEEYLSKIEMMVSYVDQLIRETDFSILYDKEIDLFSIGYNVEENKLTDSYYDLLASEARQASLIAISKKQVPSKHWNHLSRTMTTLKKYKGLVSWSGTSFEYLMPAINIPSYPGSLLDESCRFMILSQQEYTKKLGLPWGISEAAFNLKDLNSNYQYKAFGIPWLGLKRGLADEIVVSAYGTILALPWEPKEVIQNVKKLEKDGIRGRYGLYESIDYTASHLKYGEEKAVVKTFMAHHQGLILLSINNLFHSFILQKRMQQNPEMQAVSILLQERMPERLILTKEKKEEPEKRVYLDYENYTERTYNKIDFRLQKTNIMANENYTIMVNQKGESFSRFQGVDITRYLPTADTTQGVQFFFKNIQNKKLWTAGYNKQIAVPENYRTTFAEDSTVITRVDDNIETKIKILVAPNDAVEIRKIELYNRGREEQNIEVTGYLEPSLISNEYAHPAFQKLFLRYEWEDMTGSLLVERKAREKDGENLSLGVNLYTEDETIGDLEYEIDKEKFFGRENLFVPNMVKDSRPFSKNLGLVTDPMIAMKRTVRILPGKKVTLYFLMAVSHEKQKVAKLLQEYRNEQSLDMMIHLAKAKVQEEARYLGFTGKQIETYQELGMLLFTKHPIKKKNPSHKEGKRYLQKDLWKFGISGDSPILLVRVQDPNDMDVVKEALHAYEFLMIKHMPIELVLLNEEKYSYEQYVKDSIESEILEQHLAYRQNQKNGIFLLSKPDLSMQDRDLLFFTASYILEGSLGNVKSQIEEAEERYLARQKEVGDRPKKTTLLPQEKIRSQDLEKKDKTENLKYYNEYGAFSQDGSEYYIKVNKEHNLPTVWSHLLCNEEFGTVVTEGMGGYTWKQNSRLNRITSWNNNQTQDIPSEILYITDEKMGKSWSLGFRPMPDDNDYYITYGFGYARYEHTSLGIVQEADVFVPRKGKAKVTLLHIRNTNPEKRTLRFIYYLKPVLGEDEVKTNGKIEVSKEQNVVYARNQYTIEETKDIVYVTSNQNIQSFTGNKTHFMGKGTIQNPEALQKMELDRDSGLEADSCIAISFEVELNSFEQKDITLVLGVEEELLDAKNMAYQYSNVSNCLQELSKIKQYWYSLLHHLQIQTPVESMNILLNGWLGYQMITSRLWGRTGYYQSGGAFGFRDQLQDTLGLKLIDSTFMKKQIIKHSEHQFKEGDVEHWWHDDIQKGIRTHFSDDLLWLPYMVGEYIKLTGDTSILDYETYFLEGNSLPEGIMEKYDTYLPSKEKGSIYEHCIRAIEKSLNFGENGLPKIGSGDWNDGFSEVGTKGKGESVWLGFFLYEVLKRMIPLIEEKGEENRANRYHKVQEDLRRALNKNGWDGRWYKRAFMDNGDVLGSMENEECRIDNIAQSWSVISGAGDNDKKYISMESLENHLVDRENGIIKLLDPPFEKSKLEPGYIKSYLPGVRENGGQYTHGAIWSVIAEAMLGFGDKATEFFRMINPIEHARTKEMAQKYKVEPYVIAADVYGAENLAGRGGWTWYTGSASWMYKAGIEFILGFQIEKNKVILEPCIPKEWKEYKIDYRYGNDLYHITVYNKAHKNGGITHYTINGEEKEGNQIELTKDGKVYEIEAYIEE